MAGAATAATTAASAGKPARGFWRRAVRGAIPGAEDRKLDRVALARALRAANLLLLVEHNLLEARLAIFANVFVNGHLQTSSGTFHYSSRSQFTSLRKEAALAEPGPLQSAELAGCCLVAGDSFGCLFGLFLVGCGAVAV